jgi:hypothetical protein
VPWHEASCFVPPNKWFHQHFNAGGEPARYLALHPPMQFHGHAEKVEDRAKDQIEYVNEDPWVREKFEGELEARTHVINAAGNLHQPGFRMELEAVFEKREVRPSTDHRGRLSSADRRGAGDEKAHRISFKWKVPGRHRSG